MTSKKSKRQQEIIEILQQLKGATVKQLATQLNVSEMTIRRDLRWLEEQQLIQIISGVAFVNKSTQTKLDTPSPTQSIYSININTHLMQPEKQMIGKVAATLLQENDIVGIDIGTTTEKLSQQISDDLSFTALVFSANNLLHLLAKPNATILLSGGRFHRDTGMFEQANHLNVIEGTRTTKFFLSAAGVHENLGITCANEYEVLVKNTMIKNTLQTILVADSSKFGHVSSSYVGDLSSVDTIVTDSKLTEEWRELIHSLDIELIIADTSL